MKRLLAALLALCIALGSSAQVLHGPAYHPASGGAIAIEQSTTCAEAWPDDCVLTLNGVASGNTLIVIATYYRPDSHPNSGEKLGGVTDSAGTLVDAYNPVAFQWFAPATYNLGVATLVESNAASGTHVVTLDHAQWNRANATLIEVSGLATSSVVDVSASATGQDTGTSQSTGTTGTTAQANELAIIAIAMGASGGSSDIGFTNPVSGYTTLHVIPNDSSDVATFHAYKVLSGTGTQSATFNWTYSEADQGRQALIVTFKGS